MSPISEDAWKAGKARARDAERALRAQAARDGADIPDDAPFLAEVTYLNPQTGETTRQGYAWLISREAGRRADLVTWLLSDAVIPADKLAQVEAYDAKLSMTRAIFDEIHIVRTGERIDLSESAGTLRKLRTNSGQKST